MIIRVNCNNILNLNNFNKLKVIRLDILSYKLNKDTLVGDVKISGEYFKKEISESTCFEDIVPFTVVFRNEKVKIHNVLIENDVYKLIENQGVDVNFDLVVNYSIKDENENEENKEKIIEVPVEINDDLQMVINEIEDEKEIIEKYENILDELLYTREETQENVLDNIQFDNINENKVSFKNQSTTYNNISIFYLSNEKQMESISRERRISISDLYKQNSDFEKTKRIIIND